MTKDKNDGITWGDVADAAGYGQLKAAAKITSKLVIKTDDWLAGKGDPERVQRCAETAKRDEERRDLPLKIRGGIPPRKF